MTKRRVRRGWKKIEEFRHKMSGIKVGIYLETLTSQFDAEIDHQRFQDSSMEGLRQRLEAYLDKRAGVEWQDVIEVEITSGHRWMRDETKLGIDMERFLVSGLMFNEKHLRTTARQDQYDTPENRLRDARPTKWDVKELGELKPPCANEDRSVIYLPYSEAMWKMLEEVKKRISKARENLVIMLLEQDEAVCLERLNLFLLPKT